MYIDIRLLVTVHDLANRHYFSSHSHIIDYIIIDM